MTSAPITLRPYQRRAIGNIRAGFDANPAQLLVMPTGTGKTTVFAAVAREWLALSPAHRVAVLVHREELLRQAKGRLAADCGIDPDLVGVERAGDSIRRMCARPRLVVASVPTLIRRRRLEMAFPPDSGPWLVVVDECHHGTADGWEAVINYLLGLAGTRALGVTATPARHDGSRLTRLFPAVADSYPLADALADGWLVPVEQRRVIVEGLDFSKCRIDKGDFSEKDLERLYLGDLAGVDPAELEGKFEEIIKEEGPLHKIVSATHQEVDDRPTLVFCVTVLHALATAYMLDRYRPGQAIALHGKSDEDFRKETVGKFLAGGLQFLVNVGLFLEGFDAPNASCIVMARPTKSLPLYTQIAGRVLRPLPGVVDWPELAEDPAGRRNAIARSRKPYALILDFAGNAGRHHIADAVDLLAAGEDDEVKERARKIIEEAPGPRAVKEAVEEARGDVELLLDQKLWRERRHIKAQAVYRTETVELVAGAHAHRRAGAGPVRRGDRAPGDGPTPGQVRHLRWLGVAQATIDTYTKKQASAVITSMRLARGLPTR